MWNVKISQIVRIGSVSLMKGRICQLRLKGKNQGESLNNNKQDQPLEILANNPKIILRASYWSKSFLNRFDVDFDWNSVGSPNLCPCFDDLTLLIFISPSHLLSVIIIIFMEAGLTTCKKPMAACYTQIRLGQSLVQWSLQWIFSATQMFISIISLLSSFRNSNNSKLFEIRISTNEPSSHLHSVDSLGQCRPSSQVGLFVSRLNRSTT